MAPLAARKSQLKPKKSKCHVAPRKRKAVDKTPTAWKRAADKLVACHCTLLSLLAFAMPYLTVSGQEDEIQSLELFAGKQAISRQTQKFGFRAVALDKTYSDSPIMDLTTMDGFKHALSLAMRLGIAFTCWAAPVCSSWVWVSRSSTGRRATCPEGNLSCLSVREGNLQVKLTVTVLPVAFLRGAFVYVEQPCSSLMSLYEPMKSFIELIGKQRCRVALGAYGADSAKPIYIYTNDPNIERFQKRIPGGTEFKQLCCKGPGGAVTGLKTVLTASQAYPEDFGRVVAEATASNLLSSYGLDDFAK